MSRHALMQRGAGLGLRRQETKDLIDQVLAAAAGVRLALADAGCRSKTSAAAADFVMASVDRLSS